MFLQPVGGSKNGKVNTDQHSASVSQDPGIHFYIRILRVHNHYVQNIQRVYGRMKISEKFFTEDTAEEPHDTINPQRSRKRNKLHRQTFQMVI